jgi:hypothetical protein
MMSSPHASGLHFFFLLDFMTPVGTEDNLIGRQIRLKISVLAPAPQLLNCSPARTLGTPAEDNAELRSSDDNRLVGVRVLDVKIIHNIQREIHLRA